MSSAAVRIGRSRTLEQLEAVLGEADPSDPEVRSALHDLFRSLQRAPLRKDQGAAIRTRIVTALRSATRMDDRPILDAALDCHEIIPPSKDDTASGLRAAALVALADLAPSDCVYAAIEELADRRGVPSSGEPHRTAVRVLHALGADPVVAAYLLSPDPWVPEAIEEGLAFLTDVPSRMASRLGEKYITDDDASIAASAYTMLLDRHATSAIDSFVADALLKEERVAVFRYAVLAAAARRRVDLVERLQRSSRALLRECRDAVQEARELVG